MSDAFYLPVALNVAPSKWMTALIVGLHCLPLPLVAVGGVVAWPLGAVAGLSLAFHLHRQRRAKGAIRLEATAAGQWRLHRRAAPGRGEKIELTDQTMVGGWALLLVTQNRRRFRLGVRAGDQPREQWHRLRVLQAGRMNPSAPLGNNRAW